MSTIAVALSRKFRESELVEPLEGNRVRCQACGIRCPIPAGFSGVCKVRYNSQGRLYAPYGYVHTVQLDPIEKKPFFHALPGSAAFSYGMLGCNLHCGYCQNWISSQALRDFRSHLDFESVDPRRLVEAALRSGASSIISTYNEPLITSEWNAAVFREARNAGLVTGYVSNGLATPEVLRFLRPVLDLYKVDLKTLDKRRYADLGGRLDALLDSIRRIHDMGFWLEVVTMVVPGFTDTDEELGRMAQFLASISPDIPYHLTAFHPDYRMMDRKATSTETLTHAAEIARAAGLRHVYSPGMQDTRCASCEAVLVRRRGFRVLESRIAGDGDCPQCGKTVPGMWSSTAPPHRLDGMLHCRCG